MSYVLLLLGFALLIKGADFFVDGSSSIARLLNVSPLLIGLTIVAFGTSSPEATASIIAALNGNPDVALGNVIGSNMFNITLVVGLTALLSPLIVTNATLRKEIPFTLLASIALYIFINDQMIEGAVESTLSRSEGLILLLIFCVFLYYIFEVARTSPREQKIAQDFAIKPTWGKNIFLSILGLAMIIGGGELVIRHNTAIAFSHGMSETLVGLTIVAIGTSLPELVTSLTAALKKESEIALGNIVGSSIFNIFFVLGTAATITPMHVDSRVVVDLLLLIFLTLLLLVFSRTRYTVGKYEGLILASFYIGYMVYIIWRN
jgi:cation:H+ antiporter